MYEYSIKCELMRTDIFSFHQGSNDFLVEMHSSQKKAKKLTEEELKDNMVDIAKLLPQPEEITRVIVDSQWKKVQIVKKDGRQETKSLAAMKKAVGKLKKESKQGHHETLRESQLKASLLKETEKPEAILVASTDEAGRRYVKGGFLEPTSAAGTSAT